MESRGGGGANSSGMQSRASVSSSSSCSPEEVVFSSADFADDISLNSDSIEYLFDVLCSFSSIFVTLMGTGGGSPSVSVVDLVEFFRRMSLSSIRNIEYLFDFVDELVLTVWIGSLTL